MAKKPAIQMTNGIDDIIKGGKKLLYRAADAMPKSNYKKQVKTAKKYAKERVVIQNKYDAQYAAEAAETARRKINAKKGQAILDGYTQKRRAGGSKF